MQRSRIVVLSVLLTGLTWVGCASARPIGGPPPDQAPPVVVTLHATGNEECATAAPKEADIWRGNDPNEPHQVRWIAAGHTDYRWWIAHDPEKAAGNNYFGDQEIPCGERRLDSGPPQHLPPPGSGDQKWAYKVALYACPYKAGDAPVCTLDPVIIIKDEGQP